MSTAKKSPSPRTNLVFSSPRPDGTVIVYNPVSDHHLRLGREAFALLVGIEDVDNQPTLSADARARLLAGFRDHDLLEDDETTRTDRRPVRRLRVTRLSSIEFTIGDPSNLLALLRPIVTTIAGRRLAALQLVVITIGLWAMVASAETISSALTERPGGGLSLAVLGLIVVSMAVHELAHALVLHHYGGTVRRIGILLFYLAPAMFCDVSDTWLLSERRQRLRVATAGVEANVVLASVAALGLTAQPPPTMSHLLSWAVLGNLALAIVNLNPFVRLDGYWILAIAIDEPNLRAGLDRRRASQTGSPHVAVRIAWSVFAVAGRATGAMLFVAAIAWYWSLR